MKTLLLHRFLEYVKIDTQSDENSDTVPSTDKQFVLAELLVKQLKEMGMDSVQLSDTCYVYAKLNSNIPENHPAYGNTPKIGFIAHLDTAPATTGANVRPRVIENYPGGDISISKSLTLTPNENTHLKTSVGHTVITTDGTTLLGADDKAGIAIIMSALNELINTPSVLHPAIRVAFTPDEEIGKGTLHFDLEQFDADLAYTIDGGPAGEINKETFSADSATISITGADIHPGEAKNIMVNALRIAGDIISRMPKKMAPETTEKRQPFIHPYHVEGSIATATVKCLLRAFDTETLDAEKKILEDIISDIQEAYPKSEIKLIVRKNYRNMRDVLETEPLITDHLETAVKQAGLEPRWIPIRGGTDGSGLTAMGLPCPNIFTGGHNFHGPTEWISLDMMEKSVETVLHLIQVWANEA